MRLVAGQPNTPAWRAVLLADAGAANIANDSGTNTVGQMPVVEFIVRTDGGAVISVVQANDAGFHVGDRATILRGDRTRLARPG